MNVSNEVIVAIITGIFSVFLFFIKNINSNMKDFQISVQDKITAIDKSVAVISSSINFLVKEIEDLKNK